MRYYIVFVLGVFLTNISVAGECSAEVCGDVYIDKLILTPSTNVIKIGTSGDEMKLSCKPLNSQYIPLRVDALSGKETYSALLAAQMANKRVNIIVFSGSSQAEECILNYVSLAKQ